MARETSIHEVGVWVGVGLGPDVGVRLGVSVMLGVLEGRGVLVIVAVAGAVEPVGVKEGVWVAVVEPKNLSPKSKTNTSPLLTGSRIWSGVVDVVPGGLVSVRW